MVEPYGPLVKIQSCTEKMCFERIERHTEHKQPTFIQSNTVQVYFNLVCYLEVCATCFSLYLGHLHVCQYKNLNRKIQ
jgi:hypothetical protein